MKDKIKEFLDSKIIAELETAIFFIYDYPSRTNVHNKFKEMIAKLVELQEQSKPIEEIVENKSEPIKTINKGKKK